MGNNLASHHGVPYSVLFPEVYLMVELAMKRHFRVLRLLCVKPFLEDCAENLTKEIVSMREQNGAFVVPVLVLDELHDFAQIRIDSFIEEWHDRTSYYDDPSIARASYPKVFEFVREQILEKEQTIEFLSESDIAALCALVMKNNHVFYQGSNWISNKQQVSRTFKKWFVEVE